MENELWGKLYHKVVDSGIWALLKPGDKSVYIVLVRHANFETGICRPGIKTISKGSGVYRSNISKITKRLEEVGLIKKWKLGNRGYYKINQEIEVKEDIFPSNTETYLRSEREINYRRDKRTGKFKATSVEHGNRNAP